MCTCINAMNTTHSTFDNEPLFSTTLTPLTNLTLIQERLWNNDGNLTRNKFPVEILACLDYTLCMYFHSSCEYDSVSDGVRGVALESIPRRPPGLLHLITAVYNKQTRQKQTTISRVLSRSERASFPHGPPSHSLKTVPRSQ